jgi:hypothetical protein
MDYPTVIRRVRFHLLTFIAMSTMRLRFPMLLSYLLCLLALQSVAARENNPSVRTSKTLSFEQNKGQIVDNLGQRRPDILFTGQTTDAQVYFSQHGIHYIFRQDQPLTDIPLRRNSYSGICAVAPATVRRLHRVDMDLVGSNPSARILAEEQAEEYSNYYLAHCTGTEDIRTYGKLVYRDIYPFIDLVFYMANGKLKYDFIVHPGGNVDDIVLRYTAADAVELVADGRLRIRTSLGVIEEEQPYSYQFHSGIDNKTALGSDNATAIQSRYILRDGLIRFGVGTYDRSHDLIIDPGVIFSTYYGGSNNDVITDMAVDKENNIVVTGYTYSPVFAATPGVFQDTVTGDADAFISKFTMKGQRLWSTYLGGSNFDQSLAIAIDSIGGIIIGGQTFSDNFPDTLAFSDTLYGATSDLYEGTPDGFIFKCTASGRRTWATYLGGKYADEVSSIAVSALGNIYLTGSTTSDRYTFPLRNASQLAPGGVNEAFIMSFSSGGGLLWSTFYGGSDDDYAYGIAIDRSTNIYIVGRTFSTDLSQTTGRFQPGKRGYSDAFVLRLTQNGNFDWATYYGGTANETGTDIAIDADGNIILVGVTDSGDFPVRNAVQSTYTGGTGDTDAFIAKLTGNCQQVWSTYYGSGDSSETATSVAISYWGDIVVGGLSLSANFPVTSNAPQRTIPLRDTTNGFFTRLTPAGGLIFATYALGGDYIEAVAFDRKDNIILAGFVTSASLSINNAHQPVYGGGGTDGFIMRYGCDVEVMITPDKPTSFCEGGSVKLDAGAGYSSYLWNTGATTQTITVSTSGNFSVRVIDNLMCSTRSSVIVVDVHPLPAPTMLFTTSTTFCEGGNVLLMLDRAYSSYRWSDNSTGATLLATKAGTYSVTVTDGNGCSASTSTNVTVHPVPLVAYRTTMDFGLIPGCRSDAVDTISIRNTGSEEIELVGADINNAEFSILPVISSPIKLAVGNRQQFSVRFRPSGLGVVSGTLTFRIQPCNREYVVSLRGEKQSVTAVNSNISTLNFGAQYLCNGYSYDTTVTIYNGGTEAVTVGAGKTTAPFSTDVTGLPKVVNPGDSVQITVRYTPTVEGLQSGELSVPYVAGNCEDTLRFVLGGSAIDGVLSADVPTIDFGSLSGCEDATSATFHLRAAGAANLTVRSVSGDENFGVLTTLPLEFTSGSEQELLLEFRPKSEGVFSGTLRIMYTVGNCEKELTIQVSGRKEGVSFAVTNAIDFGELVGCVSQSSVATITLGVSGGGGVDGEVRSVNVQGPFSTTLAAGEQLVSGQTKAYSVNFTPGNAGEYTGSLTVVLEPCGITKVIELRGRRSEASMTTDVTTIDYGTLEEGTTTRQSVSVINNGTTAIWLERIEGVTAPFAVVAPAPVLPMRLAPGDRLVVQIEYTATVGTQQSELRFETDRPCALNSVVSLQGTGEATESVRGSATIAIPSDLRADVYTREYRIPMMLVSQNNLQSSGVDGFTVEVTYDATVFHLRGVSEGSMVSVGQSDGYQTVRISVTGKNSYTAGDVLVEMVGDVLLGRSDRTTLSLRNVEWSGSVAVETETSDGLLTVSGICEADGARLLEYTGSFGIRNIHPNPLSGAELSIDISTIEVGETFLELYSSSGERIFVERWLGRAEEKTVRLTEDIASGLYWLILRSPTRRDAKQVTILK